MTNPNRYAIQVKGMSCQHCVKAVTQAITALDANAQVTVDLPTGMVQITSTASQDQIRHAIEEEGYELVSNA